MDSSPSAALTAQANSPGTRVYLMSAGKFLAMCEEMDGALSPLTLGPDALRVHSYIEVTQHRHRLKVMQISFLCKCRSNDRL